MSTVETRIGDIFDGPSDLIVIPCSTAGTITPFVQKALEDHNIFIRPKSRLSLGELQISPFEAGENVAQFVAFAASVAENKSSVEAISYIGFQLGEQTNKIPAIRRISAPLLGAGAGKLSSEATFKAFSDGFRRSAHQNASLIISILDKYTFEIVDRKPNDKIIAKHLNSNLNANAKEERPPRVFISYTNDSAADEQWIISLGEFLRKNGVDARLDIWHLRRGMDLPQFMTNEITISDRVIIVSDERYASKANGRLGGVGWETMIVQGDIARLPPESTKYLVIVKSNNIDSGLPNYLKTKFIIHWSGEVTDDRNCQLLLREIFDAVRAPPLGIRPTF